MTRDLAESIRHKKYLGPLKQQRSGLFALARTLDSEE